MWVQFKTLTALLLISFGHCGAVFAGIAFDAELENRIEALRLRITAERSKIFSGKVSGIGSETTESPLFGKTYSPMETSFAIAFDDVQQSIFTQRTMPYFDPLALAWVETEYANISTPQSTIAYSQKGGAVMRLDPLADATKKNTGIGSIIDPRLIGSCMAARIFSGNRFSSKLLINNLTTKDSAELLNTADDSIVELRLTSEHSQRCFFIDQKHGHTVVRILRSSRYEDVDNNIWGPFNEEHHISWEMQDDVWVPVTFDLIERQEVLTDRNRIPQTPDERQYELHKLHWTLVWNAVNTDLPPSEFSESAIDAPRGTYLFDEQNAKSKVVPFPNANESKGEDVFSAGLIGASNNSGPAIPPAVELGTTRRTAAIPKMQQSWKTMSLITLTSVLGLLGYALVRRNKHSN